MLVEVNSYSRGNTRDFVLGVQLGDGVPPTLVCTLISLKQQIHSYGKGGPVQVYEMVLADESYSLFKGVLNSGLTPQVEKDIPKIGSTMDLTSWKVILKNRTETEPLVARGVVFVDCLTWKQAPDASSTLQMLDKGVTPVEFDHCTAMFHSDFVESVLENCTFSIAESHSMEAGGKLQGKVRRSTCQHMRTYQVGPLT